MPEANVLYSVTAAVVVGLVAWVAVVLKTAKEPWTREALPTAAREREADVPVEGAEGAESAKDGARSAPPSSSLPKVVAGSAGDAGAEATAEATAVVVAKKSDAGEKADLEAKAGSDAKKDGEAEPDAKKDDAKKDDAKT